MSKHLSERLHIIIRTFPVFHSSIIMNHQNRIDQRPNHFLPLPPPLLPPLSLLSPLPNLRLLPSPSVTSSTSSTSSTSFTSSSSSPFSSSPSSSTPSACSSSSSSCAGRIDHHQLSRDNKSSIHFPDDFFRFSSIA